MRRKKKPETNNTRLAFLFCVLVALLLFFSGVAKLAMLVQSSLYDGTHRFTVLVLNTPQKNNGNIVSFSPENKTISVLQLSSNKEINIKTISISLGVPIDGYIIIANTKSVEEAKDLASLLQQSLVTYKNITSDLTIIDVAKLWLFAKTTPTYLVRIQNSNVILDQMTAVDDLIIDKVISPLFTDETITQEKISIQIVNATGISGIGSRFARLISNMGGNVVSVSTADILSNTSHVSYFGEKTYTAEKLRKFLHSDMLPLQQKEISDIIVTLGKDRIDMLQ